VERSKRVGIIEWDSLEQAQAPKLAMSAIGSNSSSASY
jgi:hypothetical protein